MLVLYAGVGSVAYAHHSFAAYDIDALEVVVGTVVAFDWVNPHTWTTIETVDQRGNSANLRLEGMSPDYLGRRGWTRYTLMPGDVIEVSYLPLKEGLPGGMLVRARLPDGTLKVMFDLP